MFGGACVGLGRVDGRGVHADVVEGMTAGRGLDRAGVAVFASWKPWRILAGAYLFGGVTLAQFEAQG